MKISYENVINKYYMYNSRLTLYEPTLLFIQNNGITKDLAKHTSENIFYYCLFCFYRE